jgi:hypothetical protein
VQLVGDGDETAQLLQREGHADKVSIDASMDLDKHEEAFLGSPTTRRP